jgi:hypothetical protein
MLILQHTIATKVAKNDTRLDSVFSALGKYAVYFLKGKLQITKGKEWHIKNNSQLQKTSSLR